MTAGKERLRILEMIEHDAITAEEGLNLLHALESAQDRKGTPLPHPASTRGGAAGGRQPIDIPDTDRLQRWKQWWTIPFLVGIVITILGGGWMFSVWSGRGFGILFLLTWIPFLSGVLILATAWGSRNSPWLHLRVRQRPGAKPARIAISVPIPFRFLAWTIRTFGHWIPDLDGSGLNDLVLNLQQSTNQHLPIIIDVDEGEEGEKVQVIIA